MIDILRMRDIEDLMFYKKSGRHSSSITIRSDDYIGISTIMDLFDEVELVRSPNKVQLKITFNKNQPS